MASTNEISENADKEFQFSVCMGNSLLKLRQATSRQSSVYFSFEVHSYDLIRPELSLSLLSASAIPFLLKISFQLQFSIFPSIQWESLTFFSGEKHKISQGFLQFTEDWNFDVKNINFSIGLLTFSVFINF